MLFACPCLNVKFIINGKNEDSSVDSNIVDYVKENLLGDRLEDFLQYDNSDNKIDIITEYNHLIGVIEKGTCSLIKCLNCNIFVYITSKSQKIFFNPKCLHNEYDIENLKKNSNYSPIFRIILNKDKMTDETEELKTAVCSDELKRFPVILEDKVRLYLEDEKNRITEKLKQDQLKYERDYLVLEAKTKVQMNTFISKLQNILSENQVPAKALNSENKKISESVESGYADESSNISDSSHVSSTTNETHLSSYKKSSEKKSKQNINNRNDLDQIFCFEDNETVYNDEKSDILIESEVDDNEDTPKTHKEAMNNKAIINNDDNQNISLKYSCSVPRSIPSNFVSKNRVNENQKNGTTQEEDNFDLDENSADLGHAFAQLASSIVYKDGKELFGDRPSRRIPINSISKSCCFDN